MILRSYRKEDSDIICGWIETEEELYRWSADIYNKYPLSGSDIDENYSAKIREGTLFPLMAVDENDTVLGHFIIRYPKEDDHSVVRFGFVILNPALRGQGCGRQMLSLGVEYVKTHLTARRIELGVFANNPAAQRCYTSLGFKEYRRRMCEMPIGTWECIDMELVV